jgi:hypothetical protein
LKVASQLKFIRKSTVLLVAIGVTVGLAVTVASGFFKQTALPENLWSGTTKTWGGLPFGWWGFSKIGHVYYQNEPHWFSPYFFILDAGFWSMIALVMSLGIRKMACIKPKNKSIDFEAI